MFRLTHTVIPRYLILAAIFLSIQLGMIGAWMSRAERTAATSRSAQDPVDLISSSPQLAGQPMSIARERHTATLLNDGKVLVAGGRNSDPLAGGDSSGALNSAQLFDPATGKWTDVGSMRNPRFNHVAVMLQNGRVLVAGGQNANGFLIEAEIYDPLTGMWTLTGALRKARAGATANLLPLPATTQPAKALVAGGENSTGYLNSFELYDPSTGSWTEPAQKLNAPRRDHTATSLTNGSVLIAGGGSSGTTHLDTSEIYDPNTGVWRLTAQKMSVARRGHSATLLANGRLMIAGGSSNGSNALDTVEIFNPIAQSWAALAGRMINARRSHSATMMPDGKVFAAFGQNPSGPLATMELFDPLSGTWTPVSTRAGGALPPPRINHTATMLSGGRVLLAGGSIDPSTAINSVELYETGGSNAGTWAPTSNKMLTPRYAHSATLLTTGKALIAGGITDSGDPTRAAEVYDPAQGMWTPTADLNVARAGHTATMMRDGKVLVAGGTNGISAINSAEIYNPATGSWTRTTNDLAAPRLGHTATLLRDGRVLVVGGEATALYEIFDPATGRWTQGGTRPSARIRHTATLLPNGKVLIAGGTIKDSDPNSLNTAELYDPASNAWAATGLMKDRRKGHTATLLPNGLVLAISGLRGVPGSPAEFAGSAELFDPATNAWSTTNSAAGRTTHTATLLPNGKVLATGGFTLQSTGGTVSSLASSELFDPAGGGSGLFFTSGGMADAREYHTATLLPNGKVLAAGGISRSPASTSVLKTAELFDAGLGNIDNQLAPVRPVITKVTWTNTGSPLTAEGVRFQGVSEATGGGAQASAANYPIAQLRSLANEQELMLALDPAAGKGWTNNRFSSLIVPSSFPRAPATLTIFANGVPSRAQILAPDVTGFPATISITGRIFDVNGSGFPSTVTVVSSTGLRFVAQTSASGEYSFPDLPSSALSPKVDRIEPASAPAGGGNFSLKVTGSGFIGGQSGSTVFWNGKPRTTTFVSSTMLLAEILSADLVAPGFASVVVFTPDAGGGTYSPPMPFAISDAPPPTITRITPSSRVAGSSGFTLEVIGTNFTIDSKVQWNESDRPTTYVDSTKLTAQIPASDLTLPGKADVTVETPPPGGGTSNILSFTITQPQCNYALNPSTQVFSANGGGGSVNVTAPTGCAWTAQSNVNWIGITSGSSGNGNGTVNYLVSANFGTARSGSLIIAGQTFTVSQTAGCSYSLDPTSASFPATGATIPLQGNVRVNTTSGCTWTAQSNAAWITITQGSSGNGSGTVFYSLTNNGGSARSGTMTIAGLTFTVTQAGCNYSISPTSRFVSSPCQSTGSVSVIAAAGCSWTATSNANWLSITSGSSGVGNGTVNYSVGINGVASQRTGTLTIAGQTFTLTQGAGPCIFAGPNEQTPTAGVASAGASSDIAQQGSAITYTITPSGLANGDRPVTYFPATRTVTTGSDPTGFSPSQSGGFGNQDFWAQYALLSISGTITGLGGAQPDVKLQLIDHAPYVPVPDNQKNRTGQPNSSGNYQFEQCFISGQYTVTPMSGAFSFAPGNISLLPLTLNQLGINFNATAACQPPSITTPPAAQNVCAGGTAMFSVAASGTSLTYQWRKNGAPFLGQTGSSLTINSVTTGDAGNYDVVINSACGSITSPPAALAVNSFSLSASSASVSAGGGPGSVNVNATVGSCGWTATSNAGWITITSGASGTGNGQVNYDVAINNSGSARNGTLTVAGQTYTVMQSIGNLAPQISSLSQNSAMIGSSGFTMTVTGSNFINGSRVRWNGNERTTNYISSTQLTADITAADLSSAGSHNIDVFTPPPGGGASNPLPFTVVQNYEADVSPRSGGNGSVTVSDWTLMGLFAAAIETPANGGEFQRADCAPRTAGDGVTLVLGDGRITVADWALAGRYAAGLIPPTIPGGPSSPSTAGLSPFAPAKAPLLEGLMAKAPRTLSLIDETSSAGGNHSLVIELDAAGGENSLGFSVSFDPVQWRFISASAGHDAKEARLVVNHLESNYGRIGIALALPAGRSLPAGRQQIAVVTFAPRGGDAPVASFAFGDRPVARELADVEANTLPIGYSMNRAAPLAIVSAASFAQSPLAVESIATAFGRELAGSTQAAASSPLPLILADAQVVVRDSAGIDRFAPLFFVSPEQINFLIPAGTASGNAVVTIARSGGRASAGSVEIVAASPGLFAAGPGELKLAAGLVMRINAGGERSHEPVVTFDTAANRFAASPIEIERDQSEQIFLLLFGTGIRGGSTMTATIGGRPVELTYAGAQGVFAGLDQINLRLTRDLRGLGETDVMIFADGKPSNAVRVRIE